LLCIGALNFVPACSSDAGDDEDATTDAGDEDTSGESSTSGESGTDADTGGDGDAGGDGDGDGEAMSNCAGDLAPGEYNREVMVDGVTRNYRLSVPAGYDPTAPTPLVLNYHGYGSNAGQQVFFSNMNPYADEQGFMIAYPEGIQDSGGSQAHNAGPYCCGDHDADDVGFARTMIAAIQAESCVDQRRVFSTGMSNGGYMSYRLACDAADLIAAVAPVSGAMPIDPGACAPSRPVPILAINGTADPLVPYSAATQSAEAWTAILSCPELPPSEEVFGSVTCETWADCAEGSEVVYCTAEGMGHCWPGTEFCIDPPSTLDISANETMWAFFQEHPMPE
jgi:polyhydroxybutyrate depolymerase